MRIRLKIYLQENLFFLIVTKLFPTSTFKYRRQIDLRQFINTKSKKMRMEILTSLYLNLPSSFRSKLQSSMSSYLLLTKLKFNSCSLVLSLWNRLLNLSDNILKASQYWALQAQAQLYHII